MGLINFGVPEEEIEFLKHIMKLDVFVEGGTYKGGTAKSMGEKFKKIFTIEKSNIMFEIAKENLKDTNNITLLKGDTREHLDSIIGNNENILFCERKEKKKGCNGKSIKCITHNLWDDLEIHINKFFENNTLNDILFKEVRNNSEELKQ